MAIIGLTDMARNYCGTEIGCLGRTDTQPRIAIAAGEFDEKTADSRRELYFRYDLNHRIGPFGNSVGLSMADGGEIWIGYGQTWLWQPAGSRFYTELHAMPGLLIDNGGIDLGGPIEFRSGIELGYEARNGWRYALSYDHRSNADIYRRNPGVETYMFRVSIPID